MSKIIRLLGIVAAVAACGAVAAGARAQAPTIRADGSATVFPITAEAARRFKAGAPGVEIEVKFSGTTAGFRRFCAGEIDIGNASRPINKEEIAACEASKVRFVELPIALDALTVVINPANDWAQSITLAELKRIWEPAAENKIMTWRQVRPDWPDRPIRLFGRGQDSGTYDYFTTVVVGQARASRHDYTASENEEVLVAGITKDPDALGFFGVGAFFRHWEDLRDLAIDSGEGPVHPSLEAVRAGRYRPLSRPLFLYVNAELLAARPELRAFVDAYLRDLPRWMHFTGYMPLSAAAQERSRERLRAGTTGTRFGGELWIGAGLDAL